jgi:hypothetical protein
VVALEVVGRLAPQFLDHEQNTRDRGVEGGGDPGARAGRQQSPGLAFVAMGLVGDAECCGTPHLHRRSLASQNEACPERHAAGGKFDCENASPAHRPQAEQDAFDLLHAAAARLGGEATNQPARHGQAGGDHRRRDHDARRQRCVECRKCEIRQG